MEMRKVKEELTNMVSHAAPAIQRQMDAVTSSVEKPMKQMKESVQKSAYVIAKEQARLSAQMSVIQAKAQAQIETALVKEEAKRIKAQQIIEKQKQAEQARADVVKQTAEDIIRQQKEIEDAVKRSMERITQVSQGGKYTPRQDAVTGASRLASSIEELKQRMSSVASQTEQATDNVKISFEHLNGSAAAALDNLNAKIELQKQRLIQLMSEYRQAVDQFGEQSKEAITLRGRMINLEGTINNMIGRSDKLAETLRKVAEAERLAAEEARNMGLPVPLNTEDLSVTIQKLEEIRDKSKEINRGGLGGNAADKTAKSIQNVKNRTESAAQSMRKFANTAKSSAGKASRAFLKLGDIIKNTLIVGGLYKSFRALFGFIRDGIQSAIDAPEIENMFRVALGNMAGEAEQFSIRFKKALGVDEYATKQMLGTFNNMITTMGIGTQTAYKMSKSLTILANDMASLYNVPVEQSFENLQSALSGQSEAVRKYGYVITENVIKQTAWKYGIAETGKKLNENQKVLARYLAILEQSKNAQGDMARTAGSLQNQLRILKGNIDAAGRALGSAFLPFIKAVIPWLNALAVVVQRLGTTLAKFTYSLFGLNYEEEKKKQEQITGGLGDLADAEENLGDKAEEAGEKAESALMGFDQLNVLQNHQDDELPDFDLPPIEMPDVPSLDVTDSDNAMFDDLIDKLKEKINSIATFIQDTISKLKETIKSFGDYFMNNLGGNEALSILTEAWNRFVSNMQQTADNLKRILSVIFDAVSESFQKNIPNIEKGIKGFVEGIANLVDIALTTIGGLASSATEGIANFFEKYKQQIQENIDNIITNLSSAFGSIGESFKNLTATIAQFIKDFFEQNSEYVSGYFETFSQMIFSFAQPISDFFTGVFADIAKQIEDFTKSPALQNLFDGINEFLKGMQPAFDSLRTIIETFLEGIRAKLNVTLGFIRGALEGLVQMVKDYVLGTINKIGDALKGLGKLLQGDIKGAFEEFLNFLKHWGSQIVNLGNNLINVIIKAVNGAINGFNKIKIEIPEWVPAIGGNSWSPNIPNIPLVPLLAFANGAELTKPTIGLMAEYAGASTNPEIVAPQSIMSETFLQSLVPLINAIEEGIRNVIEALKQIDFSPILNLDGTNLVRALKPYQNRENRLNGTPLFTY